MRRVRWFDEAIDDLVAHVEYVAGDSPLAARRIAERIRDVGVRLGEFATGRPGIVPGTFERVLVDIPYVLVYSVDPVDGAEVVSMRVVHQAQQWPPEA